MHRYVVNGRLFSVLALIDVDARQSHPVHLLQIVRSHAGNSLATTPKRPVIVRATAAINHTTPSPAHQNWRELLPKSRNFYTKIMEEFLVGQYKSCCDPLASMKIILQMRPNLTHRGNVFHAR